MDTDFKSIRQIALFFLSIYGLFNKSRGRMRISVLDFENGGEIRMTKLSPLAKLIQAQASNQSISDPTSYFQGYNQLAIAAGFFLGNNNVYVGMKRLFPNYDASWVFKDFAVSKVADEELQAARKDTFEEQIHCSIYRNELFEFLRPYKNDTDYRVYQIYSPYDDSSGVEFEQRDYIFKKYLAEDSDTTFVKAVDFNLWTQGQLFWHALILVAEPSTDRRDTELYHTAVAIIFDMTTNDEDPIPQIKQKFFELCKD